MGTKSAFSTEYRKICALLREARIRAGLSQQEVGQLLGQHQTFVSKYELGQRRLDVVEFFRICKTLRVKPNTLLAKVNRDFLS